MPDDKNKSVLNDIHEELASYFILLCAANVISEGSGKKPHECKAFQLCAAINLSAITSEDIASKRSMHNTDHSTLKMFQKLWFRLAILLKDNNIAIEDYEKIIASSIASMYEHDKVSQNSYFIEKDKLGPLLSKNRDLLALAVVASTNTFLSFLSTVHAAT